MIQRVTVTNVFNLMMRSLALQILIRSYRTWLKEKQHTVDQLCRGMHDRLDQILVFQMFDSKTSQ